MQAKVTWKQSGLLLTGTNSRGSQVDLASGLDGDAPGFRPMELMAVGLAGCTAMDVLSIIQKKRQDVTDFAVEVYTTSADEHPYVWTSVRIKYIVTGHGVEPAAVERAIELSEQTYCPAQNMINKCVDIDLEYEIIEA